MQLSYWYLQVAGCHSIAASKSAIIPPTIIEFIADGTFVIANTLGYSLILVLPILGYDCFPSYRILASAIIVRTPKAVQQHLSLANSVSLESFSTIASFVIGFGLRCLRGPLFLEWAWVIICMKNHSHDTFQESWPNLNYDSSQKSCHGSTEGGSFATTAESFGRAKASYYSEIMLVVHQDSLTSTARDNPDQGKSTKDFDYRVPNQIDNLYQLSAFVGSDQVAQYLSDGNFNFSCALDCFPKSMDYAKSSSVNNLGVAIYKGYDYHCFGSDSIDNFTTNFIANSTDSHSLDENSLIGFNLDIGQPGQARTAAVSQIDFGFNQVEANHIILVNFYFLDGMTMANHIDWSTHLKFDFDADQSAMEHINIIAEVQKNSFTENFPKHLDEPIKFSVDSRLNFTIKSKYYQIAGHRKNLVNFIH